jgi:dTDP-4-dehydrorhamnose 3,5-epimerase
VAYAGRCRPYSPECEHTINALDPVLDIAWPTSDGTAVLSDRDRDAPTLAEVAAAGLCRHERPKTSASEDRSEVRVPEDDRE